LLAGKLPLSEQILVVSGRSSFELLQKALVASLPIMVAVGAPSSLAVELAEEFNLTLIGFASQTRFNVYSAPHRIDQAGE
jgi:FdhD protein